MDKFLETANVATIVILALTVTGCVLAIVGDVSYEELIRLLDVPLAGLAVGRGLAAKYRNTAAR